MSTKTITRTVLGALLQTNNLLNANHRLLNHSTLNEKFQIHPPTQNDADGGCSMTQLSQALGIEGNGTKNPYTKCLVIGNKGHRMAVGADSTPYTAPNQHRCTDFALFNHIPFAIRNVDEGEDVTGGSFIKANYCLRKAMVVSGVNYAYYYGRRLDLTNVAPTIRHLVEQDGQIISTENFIPTSDNLNPLPPDPPNNQVVNTIADYLTVSALLQLILTPDDIDELKNVANVIYGTEDLAIISEMGVCTGLDTTQQYNGIFEVVACQILTHMVSYHQASSINNGLQINLELGATEPLLSIS